MSGIERGARLPSLPTFEKLTAALRVSIKDLFGFNDEGFRRMQALSREGLDMAYLLENVPLPERRRIVKVVRILTRPRS